MFDMASAVLAACPGCLLTPDMTAALYAAAEADDGVLTDAQVQAIVLPLMPEGNPPAYTIGQPSYPPPVLAKGATPLVPPTLPPQPDVLVPVDNRTDMGTVATFAQGLVRFQDSNPDPRDGWSIEVAEDHGLFVLGEGG